MESLYRLGILVLSVVAGNLAANLANNDLLSDLDANVTTSGTLVNTLCFGHPLNCVWLQNLDPTKIDCDGLGITEIPSWNETRDGRIEGPVSISFRNNQLTKIVQIATSDVIETLSFDGNDIGELGPYAFQGLKENLKVLSLRDNRLDKIGHRDFHSFSPAGLVLEVLDLRDNYLVHVDDDAFEQLPRLKVLRLSNNPIHALDLSTIQALNSVHGLQILHLSHAQLTELPSTQLVNPIRNLLELDLSYNRLDDVPVALQNAKQLVKLNLDGNLIFDLDALSLLGLDELEELDMNNMTNLKTIYIGAFTRLTKLTSLRCSNNIKLSGIETEAFFDHHGYGATSLKTIILKNNNLSVVNQESFARIPNVTLELEGNPLYCSCNLAWLNASHGNLRCRTPASLSGRLLKDVDFSRAPCGDRIQREPHQMIYFGLAVSMGGLFLALIFGAVFVIARRAKMPFPNAHYRRAENNEACNLYNE